MSERTVRVASAVILGLLYAGLLGYSVMGSGEPEVDPDTERTRGTVPPRVMHHDDDVNVYGRRSVRSSGQRGGGIRGGK